MTTERDIQRRIESVGNVRQITRTMKAVASAKLSRAQARIERTRPYAGEIEESIRAILARHPEVDHPFLADLPASGILSEELDTRPGYLVLTADRGLCAAFNANVLQRAEEKLERRENAVLYPVGQRGVRYFQRHEAPVASAYPDFWGDLEYGQAVTLANQLAGDLIDGDRTSVTIIHNEFESAMVQNVVEYPLLPLNRDDFVPEMADEGATDFLYEPDAEAVIEELFPRHLRTQVFTALLESFAAEQGARMVAMDNATENATEMIDDLTLEYNRARQSSITREIADITGAAEALREE